MPRLRLFQKFSTFRILVCGGDGSVGWVLSEIDALGLHKQVSESAWHCWRGLALCRCWHHRSSESSCMPWGAASDRHFGVRGVVGAPRGCSEPPALSLSHSASWASCPWGPAMTWHGCWAGAAYATMTPSCCRSWRSWKGPPPRCWTGELGVGRVPLCSPLTSAPLRQPVPVPCPHVPVLGCWEVAGSSGLCSAGGAC